MRRVALTLAAMLWLVSAAPAVELRTDTSKAVVALDEIISGGPPPAGISAVDRLLPGERLRTLPHVDAFWFAWAAFHPETSLHGDR